MSSKTIAKLKARVQRLEREREKSQSAEQTTDAFTVDFLKAELAECKRECKRERDELQQKLEAKIRRYAEDVQGYEDRLASAGINAHDHNGIYKGVGYMIDSLIDQRDGLRNELSALIQKQPKKKPPSGKRIPKRAKAKR